MQLVQPGIGLIFWMTLSFGILLYILAKFAWKPILTGLREREATIDEALNAAERAKEEMKKMTSDNEELLKQAKEERDEILKAARHVKEKMIEDAKVRAVTEADRIVEAAKENIHFEKMAALTELKNQIATLSIEIAEKVLKEELADKERQQKLVNKLIDDVNFN